jgi:hypothetical protein
MAAAITRKQATRALTTPTPATWEATWLALGTVPLRRRSDRQDDMLYHIPPLLEKQQTARTLEQGNVSRNSSVCTSKSMHLYTKP